MIAKRTFLVSVQVSFSLSKHDETSNAKILFHCLCNRRFIFIHTYQYITIHLQSVLMFSYFHSHVFKSVKTCDPMSFSKVRALLTYTVFFSFDFILLLHRKFFFSAQQISYDCQICKIKFSSMDALQQHILQVHDDSSGSSQVQVLEFYSFPKIVLLQCSFFAFSFDCLQLIPSFCICEGIVMSSLYEGVRHSRAFDFTL